MDSRGLESDAAISVLGSEDCQDTGTSTFDHAFDQCQVEPTGGLPVLVAQNTEGTVAKASFTFFFGRLIPGSHQRRSQTIATDLMAGAPGYHSESRIAGDFWDIALRDFGLLLGAVALGQLAQEHA